MIAGCIKRAALRIEVYPKGSVWAGLVGRSCIPAARIRSVYCYPDTSIDASAAYTCAFIQVIKRHCQVGCPGAFPANVRVNGFCLCSRLKPVLEYVEIPVGRSGGVIPHVRGVNLEVIGSYVSAVEAVGEAVIRL